MWAQAWNSRFDDLIPYPDAPLIDMTRTLQEKKYSIHKMYTTAEKFFTSIGLYPMTPKFWARSMFQKPKDRSAVCHAAAMDFGYHDDYRVRICTEINDDNFYTVHHEMGHIEYYMAYTKEQPYIYRDGANSGFHEAIGDTIGMYASKFFSSFSREKYFILDILVSPAHLVKLGFVNEEDITPHYEINYLMRLALQKVAFIPFSYIMDKYRFALFRNQINREYELNSMWWALRIEHEGIMAAVPRSDATNFDAGAKYHIPANVPYLRYFIAHILQFQFYRGLCRLQGVTKRLHMCDIYGNKDVGDKFKDMLGMGSSKPWAEILESLTGETKLEPQAMLDFFKPLHTWLKKENIKRNYTVGWM
jgi:peptidyl-dipeptidase A